jgi:hypothetical protein
MPAFKTARERSARRRGETSLVETERCCFWGSPNKQRRTEEEEKFQESQANECFF